MNYELKEGEKLCLRKDLKSYYGTAAFNGFPTAVVDLMKVERMSDQEIVEFALTKNFNLEKYKIQE